VIRQTLDEELLVSSAVQDLMRFFIGDTAAHLPSTLFSFRVMHVKWLQPPLVFSVFNLAMESPLLIAAPHVAHRDVLKRDIITL
jgi:hypothetical protein